MSYVTGKTIKELREKRKLTQKESTVYKGLHRVGI